MNVFILQYNIIYKGLGYLVVLLLYNYVWNHFRKMFCKEEDKVVVYFACKSKENAYNFYCDKAHCSLYYSSQ